MKLEDNQNSNTYTWLDDPLTLKEFRDALISFRKNSAPELDKSVTKC